MPTFYWFISVAGEQRQWKYFKYVILSRIESILEITKEPLLFKQVDL